jgi:hypothetical protein
MVKGARELCKHIGINTTFMYSEHKLHTHILMFYLQFKIAKYCVRRCS